MTKATVTVILVILFYVAGAGLSRLTNSASVIFYPFIWADNYVHQVLNDAFGFFHFQTVLVADNNRLIEENNLLRAKLADRQLLVDENTQLKSLLGLKTKSGAKITLAEILSKPGQGLYDVFLLDNNREVPLTVGDKVMLENNLILGTVVGANSQIAKAQLFSSAGEKIPVTVGKNNIPAIASGLGAGNFQIMMPRDIEVKEGEVVETSLIGRHLLGLVGKIDRQPEDPFQKVYVKSPVNLYELKWVQIVK